MKIKTIDSKQLYLVESNKNNNNKSSLLNTLFKNKRKSSKQITNPWAVIVLVSTSLLMIGAAFLVYDLQSDFSQFRLERINSTWGFAFFIIALSLFAFKAVFFIYNLYLYFRYKPVSSVSDSLLP